MLVIGWDRRRLASVAQRFLLGGSVLLRSVKHLADEDQNQLRIEAMSSEAVTNGEILDRAICFRHIQAGNVQYTCDDARQRKAAKDEPRFTTTYNYAAAGRLTSTVDGVNRTTSYGHDPRKLRKHPPSCGSVRLASNRFFFPSA